MKTVYRYMAYFYLDNIENMIFELTQFIMRILHMIMVILELF